MSLAVDRCLYNLLATGIIRIRVYIRPRRIMKLELIVWQVLQAFWKNKPSLCGLACRDTLVFAQGMNKIWFFFHQLLLVVRQNNSTRRGQRSNRLAPETLTNNTHHSPPHQNHHTQNINIMILSLDFNLDGTLSVTAHFISVGGRGGVFFLFRFLIQLFDSQTWFYV